MSKTDRREQTKRKAVRTRLGREEGEKSIPDVEAVEGKISALRRQRDCAT